MASRKKDRKAIRLKRIERERLLDEQTITYNQIKNLIKSYPTDGASYLEHMLKSEISRYGERNVYQALSEAPYEAISYAENIVFYEEDSDKIHRALAEFADMITGLIPDEEKAKSLGEIMDKL